ncbi:hypothetical protein HC024_11265 [Methylococcaceae bacterium WWC4]|nr:hypothetical protein [Methylococcaceae bacterium WWC4]
MGWVTEELSGIDLGDRRLNAHSIKFLRRLSVKPSASIPAACGGWAETVAALPIFIARRAGLASYLQPHMVCTQTRMQSHSVVLCLQDTTELEFCFLGMTGTLPFSRI